MSVTANSDAMQLDIERDAICEVVTNRVRLRKRPSLMWISTATQDQQWGLPLGRKRESGAQSVRSSFQMNSTGL